MFWEFGKMSARFRQRLHSLHVAIQKMDINMWMYSKWPCRCLHNMTHYCVLETVRYHRRHPDDTTWRTDAENRFNIKRERAVSFNLNELTPQTRTIEESLKSSQLLLQRNVCTFSLQELIFFLHFIVCFILCLYSFILHIDSLKAIL